MELVYGVHLGLVVSANQDPENRNRIQVWVPHLSSTIFNSLNAKVSTPFTKKEIIDPVIKGPQDLNSIDSNLLPTLQKILPWAECAAPFFGGSSGLFNTSTNTTANTTGSTIQGTTNDPKGIPQTTLNQTLCGIKPPDTKDNSNLGINSTLANYRSSLFSAELNDSAVLNRLASTAQHEVGNNPLSQQMLIETIFNRAQFGNTSLTSVLNAQYGGPNGGWGGDPNIPASGNSLAAIGNVVNGSNLTGMATDNSSDTLAIRTQNSSSGVNGVWIDNKTGQVIPAPTPQQISSESAEFLYSASSGRYTSDQGRNAQKFANNNGIPISTANQYAFDPNATGIRNTQYTDGASKKGMVPFNIAVAGSAVGTYSTPPPGAKVFVFFMGGDIQKPVYFAQALNPGDVAALNG